MIFNPKKFILYGECPHCSGPTYTEDVDYEVEYPFGDASEIVMRLVCRDCSCHLEVFYQFKALKSDKGHQFHAPTTEAIKSFFELLRIDPLEK